MIHLFLSPSPKQIHSKTFPITEILRPFNKNLHKIFLLSCGSRQQPHSRICLLNSSEKKDRRTDGPNDWLNTPSDGHKQNTCCYFFFSKSLEVLLLEWSGDHRMTDRSSFCMGAKWYGCCCYWQHVSYRKYQWKKRLAFLAEPLENQFIRKIPKKQQQDEPTKSKMSKDNATKMKPQRYEWRKCCQMLGILVEQRKSMEDSWILRLWKRIL